MAFKVDYIAKQEIVKKLKQTSGIQSIPKKTEKDLEASIL